MTNVSVAAIAVAIASVAAAASADDRYGQQLDELVNRYRASHHARELVIDANLAALAREHSEDMVVGWNFRTPREQLDAWNASPEHAHNLLDARVSRG